jgi:hypothetical protein
LSRPADCKEVVWDEVAVGERLWATPAPAAAGDLGTEPEDKVPSGLDRAWEDPWEALGLGRDGGGVWLSEELRWADREALGLGVRGTCLRPAESSQELPKLSLGDKFSVLSSAGGRLEVGSVTSDLVDLDDLLKLLAVLWLPLLLDAADLDLDLALDLLLLTLKSAE